MPAGKTVPSFDREWMALVLAIQVVGGVILGVAAQALVAVIISCYLLPWVGLDLLELAHSVVVLDIPARVSQIFTSVL
jgi:hypothetical protein